MHLVGMNIAESKIKAAARLADAAIPENSREASSLLAFILKKPRSFLFAHPEYELTADEEMRFETVVERRAAREPFQHITGVQEFFGLEFEVSPDVLIPRPETEILVEAAIERLDAEKIIRFIEIGAGSGCVSVSILHTLVNSTAMATDISPSAIEVARRNAARHQVSDRLDLLNGDLFADISDRFDMIVSNPPYIPLADKESLQSEVVGFDPHLALFSGDDGLDMIRKLVRNAPEHLKPRSWLLFEFGHGQSESVKRLFENDMWNEVELVNDLQGIPRVAIARSKN